MAVSKSDFRIIFMGTPDFAVSTLAALVEQEFNVVAVVTSPDKPAGRGQHIQMSPVKTFAKAKDIPVLQPEKLKSEDFISELSSFKAHIQVVVAFRMLPEVVWRMPQYGSINLHASLLPDYRGAAPIHWAVINGESITGVTTFFLQHEIDTGNIIEQRSIDILPEDNTGILYDKLKELGATLMVDTLNNVINNTYKEIPQTMLSSYHHAPKIFKKDMEIDFNKSTKEVYNLIRGLAPYPGAFTYICEKQIKIFESSQDFETLSEEPMLSDNKTFLKLRCKNGYINVLSLQMEGKKRMDIQEFLRGIKL